MPFLRQHDLVLGCLWVLQSDVVQGLPLGVALVLEGVLQMLLAAADRLEQLNYFIEINSVLLTYGLQLI